MMSNINKARFWMGVCYQESMLDSWCEDIGDILQLPYAYCEHTLDVDANSDHRKDHVHIIIAFPNTTTHKHAKEVFNLLSKSFNPCCSTCEAVISIRGAYDYLIHNTESSRLKGKYQYPESARISGNNFDIGSYEQISASDKNRIALELCDFIVDNNITNFADFFLYVRTIEDTNYFEILKTYSGLFERLTKANYLKITWKGDSGEDLSPDANDQLDPDEVGSAPHINI